MDVATVMAIVQTLLTVIQTSDQIKKLCSLSRYRSELDSLQSSLKTISAVLEDADAKQGALTHQDKLYLEELSDAVYEADDVLDEFFTLIQRKKLLEDGGHLSDKVKSFLLRFKPLVSNMSKKVKDVRRKLDDIATNSSQFRIDVDDQHLRFRKEETCSYVYANDIIGREGDVENILRMLLADSNVEHDVSCLSIVGIGGLGKTALAQLVYNHESVKSAFPLRLWTCVSDENPDHLDIEATLRKILASATKRKDDNLTLDGVQSQLRGHLTKKKYLLVLDDVWSENRDDWMKLLGYLKGGNKKSWILVTTRSKQTASVIDNDQMYNLPGLSDEDSWRLFQRAAFGIEQPNPSCDELVSIGREIVKKCASVPLAIRTIGSLLFGQPLSKWRSFQVKGLANIEESGQGIKPILKLSYHQLASSLKSCFRYCAIFPKDSVMKKEELIRLWKAQGYIVPEEGQDIEDVAQQYFMILLRRCFFQDVKKDEDGEIVSCKMHDLMHDIAQAATGNEICIVRGLTVKVDEKVRHLYLERATKSMKFSGKIRTCLLTCKIHQRPAPQWSNLALDKLVEKCIRLRTLDLSSVDITSLPDSIGNMLHLRYLNLSYNRKLEVLPKSITKLHNLQTLNLRWCKGLRELPKDVGKLVNLTSLDITDCDGLTYMPSGLGKLTSLHTLDQFKVGWASSSGKELIDELETLKPLNNLKGDIRMYIRVPNKDGGYLKRDDDVDSGESYSYLRSKERLNLVLLDFEDGEGEKSSENEEGVLELLQPHPKLKKLVLYKYKGARIPKWLIETHLPNLVSLHITHCKKLRWLPYSLGRLPLLKFLGLYNLLELDFVESENPEGSSGQASSYFPCLETLTLWNLPKLREGWLGRSRSESVQNDQHPVRPSSSSFHQLKKLNMGKCPEMRCIPWFPSLDEIHFRRCFELKSEDGVIESSSDPSSSALHPDFHPKPMKLTITDLESLKLVSTEYFIRLTKMIIKDDRGVESLGEVIDGQNFSSLRSLEMKMCARLKSVCGWIEHLTALESLCIQECPNLVKNGEKGELDGIPWSELPPNLHFLQWFDMGIPPEGMHFCTSLRSLEFKGSDMKSVPHWMPKLTSLTHLEFQECSKQLKERCQKNIGEDWPLIQHITNLLVDVKADETSDSSFEDEE